MTTGRLMAGIAEREITPQPGCELATEFAPRVSTSVGSPLLAKALVLSNSAETLALVTFDLFGLESGAAARLQAEISRQCGLKPEAVMLVCSHTRSGPYTTPVVGFPGLDEEVIESIIRLVPQVVADAQSHLQPASLGAGKVIVPHLVYNHRLVTRNMKVVTAWLGVPENEVLAPEGPVDPEFWLLLLRDQRGFPLAMLWNFAADNRFVSDGQISAGLPSAVQQEVDARLGRHVPLLYLGGCGADISYVHGLDETANAAASAVMAAYLETSGDPQVPLRYAAEKMILPIRDYTCLWNQPDIELKYPQVLDAYTREIEYLQKEGAQAVPAQVQVFRVGPYAVVGLPGIPFAGLGLEIKRQSPARATLTVANVGGHLGSILPEDAFDNEGFEAWTARSAKVGRGAGEFIVEESARLLKGMWKC